MLFFRSGMRRQAQGFPCRPHRIQFSEGTVSTLTVANAAPPLLPPPLSLGVPNACRFLRGLELRVRELLLQGSESVQRLRNLALFGSRVRLVSEATQRGGG